MNFLFLRGKGLFNLTQKPNKENGKLIYVLLIRYEISDIIKDRYSFYSFKILRTNRFPASALIFYSL